MIRRKGPILAAAVIAAFALGWYRGLFGVDEASAPAVPATAPTLETAATRTEPAPVAGPDGGAAPEASGTRDASTPDTRATPGFDVVRVEPDGSAVIAGKGAANEAISLTDGTRTLGEARTDANGDFVMTLSLPQGSHRLQLAQRDDVVSDDAAVVNVPPKGRADQLLVMVQRPGEASEILRRPEEQGSAATVADADPAPTADAPSVRPEPDTEVVAATPAPPATEAPRDAASSPAGLSVEAVEIEGDRLFVAGSAKTGSTVRIYLDDRPVAETRSGAGDRFIASARADVSVGDHTIRADTVEGGSRVVGRVEVPFRRPDAPSMAAIAAPRDTTPAPAPAPAAAPAAPSETAAVSQGAPAPGERAATGTAATPATPGMEPEAVRQAPLQAAASRVIIRRGDTLWRISRDTYGLGSRYTVIYLANGDQIRDPNRIYPGQVFRMPDGEPPDAPPRG
ncbi:LysM peptidoglycan-binding domain-containing protein [Aureimonas flava]|uniref:LysM peptidoglycan-binding domain-containing protein n=1 Tax=Aureimonas flava TaxID=2320271 RepID=A0A3A1WQ47_9HYPH|nr:LysM peptidoglycan-binding domain-containing protein [Aureimonas flava]RIY03510.1 LysM peptidoglycan-binding domain-containing protein [Aureimonas flava]